MRRTWLRRSGITVAIAGLIAGFLTVVATPALAHPHEPPERGGNHCALPSFINVHINDPGTDDWVWGYEILFANKRFEKARGFPKTNASSTPLTWEFTLMESTTVSYSTTQSFSSSVTNSIIKGLSTQSQFGISSTVTQTFTASQTEKLTKVVPPWTEMTADYGFDVFDVFYIFHVYHRDKNHPERACREQGRTGTLVMTVPSKDTRWVFVETPIQQFV